MTNDSHDHQFSRDQREFTRLAYRTVGATTRHLDRLPDLAALDENISNQISASGEAHMPTSRVNGASTYRRKNSYVSMPGHVE